MKTIQMIISDLKNWTLKSGVTVKELLKRAAELKGHEMR